MSAADTSDVEFATAGITDETLECKRVDCHRPAAWAYRCPTCSRDRITCQHHRELFDLAATVAAVHELPCELPTPSGPCTGSCPIPIAWRAL